ncbi:MAG: multicopper oxidase domain-containing protein [Candidatus Reddybacter sp.]
MSKAFVHPLLLLVALVVGSPGYAADAHHHHMPGMSMDATGMVMGGNKDKLPDDCGSISGDFEINVVAGTEYAEPYASTMFGFDQHEWQVKPCSRITVNFKNEDDVRHQWMLHGLPKYLYDRGMFHMEAAGGHSQTGVFIVPSDNKTYLVHCDIAQHMEKGMKAQLIVGSGSGDLWSIPGVTADFERPAGILGSKPWYALLGSVTIFLIVFFAGLRFFR